MPNKLLGILVLATCLGALAVGIFSFWGGEQKILLPEKAEAAISSKTPISALEILPNNAQSICVLGPYQDPKFQSGSNRPELLIQIDQSSVPEGSVRVAIFDDQSQLLSEDDISRWSGQFRIVVPSADPIFCEDANAVMVMVDEQAGFNTIQFLR
ncbi:hypothetical protein J7394_09715 [Ruegeria sp. R13_0]|uniref:hypothetical protein n=1 Tax=Ruegeria sp. R13_0 TaxID=2821099 RepID=UPI001ADA648C|nr:hypothetical protein [Ruegeria sp. R13_0]MBO9434482.1 hypothetical protein [Ruegeria sp. R13_0]